MKTKYGNAKVDTGGYYRITSGKEGNHGKLLHRLIFEDYYGITILPCIVVHHKDGNKLNNSIENLELMDSKNHIKSHNTGRKHTEIEKQKMRDNHPDVSGENNPMYGKRGENSPCYGKKHSKETKRKMSENHADFTGENNPKYRHDLPTSKELLEEYQKTEVSMKKLAIKYNCSENAIYTRIKKAKEAL